MTIEDISQEGFISIVKYMRKYRFVCTVCKHGSIYQVEHDSHCEQEHGVKLEPQTKLSVYLSLNAMGRMRNVMRDLLRAKRGDLFGGVDTNDENFTELIPSWDLGPLHKSYDESISMRKIWRFAHRVEKENNPKIKQFMVGLLKYGTVEDSCERLAELGLVKNTASGRRLMVYYRKTKWLDGYREDLE